MAILVSGGAGYIGSHTCIELLNAGFDIVVADNYYNASPVVLDRVKQITGKDFRFYQADMTKHEDVEKIFTECPDIDAVIQFAAYKAVGESVSKPIEYYYNNLNCTLVILDVMRRHNCRNFVFSSSATVYGDPASVPITEDFPVGATTNPYGTTKAFTERILTDVCKADPTLNVALLRYFNPIGAHKSGLIGEDPNGIPNNLMPYIAKVAVGKLEKVHVFGNDYPTPDGTGVRDYIHVVDLARSILPRERGEKIPRDYGTEPADIAQKETSVAMEVSTPQFLTGFKCTPAPEGEDYLRMSAIGDMACDILLGDSSPLYLRLYDQGLINTSFGGAFEMMPGVAYLYAGGDSKDPHAVAQAILDEAKRLRRGDCVRLTGTLVAESKNYFCVGEVETLERISEKDLYPLKKK